MINQAKKILKHWHMHLGRAFGNRFYRHVAHQILHLPDQAHLHGSPLVHSCFFGIYTFLFRFFESDFSNFYSLFRTHSGESCIGKIVGLVSCPNVALKQMKERLTAVHSQYSELDEREMQLYEKKGRKPADADCYIDGDFSLLDDVVCGYIRYDVINIH